MNNKARDRNSEQSLCEKSMEIVTNIIKLSSFAIAQTTLGVTSTKSTNARDYAPVSGPRMVPEDYALCLNSKNAKSHEPRSHRQNPIYVTKPTATNGGASSHVIDLTERTDGKQTCKVEDVDGSADEYISKVRRQLGFEFNNKSKHSSNALVSRPSVK